MNIMIGNKTPFVETPLLIEGITRVGKFLLANVLSGIEGIEPAYYDGLFEDIPFLHRFGKIEKETAIQLLRCEMDLAAYEICIGRRINLRASDKSAIYHVPQHQKYLDRAKNDDHKALIKEYQKEKRLSTFIIHEGMPNIALYFEVYPKTRIFSLQRSPLELVYSWFQRGHGKRWGNDPLLFQIPFSAKGGPVPWFAFSWKDAYNTMTEIDRVILSIITLVNLSQESYSQLSSSQKKRITFIYYEDLLSQPLTEVERMSTVLKKNVMAEMPKILERENLPSSSHYDHETILREIRTIASPQLTLQLISLEEAYKKRTIFSA